MSNARVYRITLMSQEHSELLNDMAVISALEGMARMWGWKIVIESSQGTNVHYAS